MSFHTVAYRVGHRWLRWEVGSTTGRHLKIQFDWHGLQISAFALLYQLWSFDPFFQYWSLFHDTSLLWACCIISICSTLQCRRSWSGDLPCSQNGLPKIHVASMLIKFYYMLKARKSVQIVFSKVCACSVNCEPNEACMRWNYSKCIYISVPHDTCHICDVTSHFTCVTSCGTDVTHSKIQSRWFLTNCPACASHQGQGHDHWRVQSRSQGSKIHQHLKNQLDVVSHTPAMSWELTIVQCCFKTCRNHMPPR